MSADTQYTTRDNKIYFWRKIEKGDDYQSLEAVCFHHATAELIVEELRWAATHRPQWAALVAERDRLRMALQEVESHHAQLNAEAGRPSSRSRTLRIVRGALYTDPVQP